MIYTRGSSDDFDRYAEISGDEGWSWDNMLPYFKKNEKWTAPKDGHNTSAQYLPETHGFDGVTAVSLAGYPSAIDDMVFEASDELQGDYAYNVDMNAGNPLGFGGSGCFWMLKIQMLSPLSRLVASHDRL